MKPELTEFQKFDELLGKVISVSHDELKRREAEWRKQRKRKKRTRISPASHGPAA